MRIITLLPVLAVIHTTAQITLETPEHVPLPGLQYTVSVGPFATPGAGGANQTWDFSAMGATSTDTLYFVDPATTPNGADFVGATVALFDGDQSYGYYQATGTEFLFVGNDDGNISFPMSDPSKFWPFPCAYQDTWTDLLGGTVVIQGQNVTRTGSVSGIADGHGTLLLPFGAIDDVLRVVVDEDHQDATPLGTVIHDVQTHYFFKRFLPFPVLQITNRSLNVNGSITTSQTAQWVDSSAVGVLEQWAVAIGMQVLPNPATSNTTVVFGAEGDVELSVVDPSGRVVALELLRSLAPGNHTHALDVSALAKGTYVVHAVNAKGERGTRKLMVD